MAKFDVLYRPKKVFEGFNWASIGLYNTYYTSKLKFGPNSIIYGHSMLLGSEKLPYDTIKAYFSEFC